MALLLVILIPLAALAIYAVVFDLRRRRRGAPRSHDISSQTPEWQDPEGHPALGHRGRTRRGGPGRHRMRYVR